MRLIEVLTGFAGCRAGRGYIQKLTKIIVTAKVHTEPRTILITHQGIHSEGSSQILAALLC